MPNLFYLVRLGFRCFRLQIQNLLDPILAEYVMVSLGSLLKSKMSEQLTQIV